MSRTSHAEGSAWILQGPTCGARVKLFCFPHAGGGAASYRVWMEALQPHIQVLPVQLPGRETRFQEPLIDRMEPIVEALVPVVASHATAPIALFGHSMGALIAFELTRALVAAGVVPAHLFVSGTPPPQRGEHIGVVHKLSDDELVQYMQTLGGTAATVLNDPSLLELLLPILRADHAVCETYRCASPAPLPVPITCLGGLEDPLVSRQALATWEENTSERCSIHRFPGGHFFLHDVHDEVLGIIARHLSGV